MTLLNEDQRKHYKNEGYLIVPNVIDKSLSIELYRAVVHLARKYSRKFPKDVLDLSPWENSTFCEAMLQMRAEIPDYFGAMYDCLQNSALLNQLSCNSQTITIASELLREPLAGIATSGVMMRIDTPHDTRNSLAWHQESFYYNQNLRGENGCVLWYPLHSTTIEHGAIVLCPGSHHAGKYCVSEGKKSNYGDSEQFDIPDDYIRRYETLTAVAKFGDALFFNMDLLHRSGLNSSDKIRFSAGIRFHKMLSDDFLPGRNIYKPNAIVGRSSEINPKQENR